MRTCTLSRSMIASTLVLASAPAFGQTDETIYVTAARMPLSADDATASITLLDEAEIEARGGVFVADILRAVPGLAVSRSGPAGSLTQIRARGSEANHVVLLIDGVEANNPFTGEADFSNLAFDDIGSIEVSRGEQSALWGADAIGGVIRLNSRLPEAGREFSARFEAGSFDTYRGSARLAARKDAGWASVSLSSFVTDGVDVSGRGGETDGYENTTAALAGGYALSPALDLDASLRWIDSKSEFDSDTDFDGRLDDVDRDLDSERWLARTALTARQDLSGAELTHEFAIQLTEDLSVRRSPGSPDGRSLGQRLQGHYLLGAQWDQGASRHRVSFLVEREQDRLKSFSGPAAGSNQTRTIETDGIALDYGLSVEAFDLNLSVRRDSNSLFEDATTWRAGAGWAVAELDGRVHVAAGEGVKNPGIFELFGFFPAFWQGNPDLQPERSRGWEIGWTQSVGGGRGHWAATWFSSELENEIFSDFGVFPATARNAAQISERTGLEVEASWDLNPDWSLFGSASLLDSQQNGVAEIRRPERLASLTLDWHPSGSDLSGSLTFDHTGDQLDTDFGTFQSVTLDAYTLVGGQLRWQAADGVEIYARGENLLDEDYQDVFGFFTQGRGLYLGLRLQPY